MESKISPMVPLREVNLPKVHLFKRREGLIQGNWTINVLPYDQILYIFF